MDFREVQGHLIHNGNLGNQFEVTGSMQEVTSMLIDKVMGDRPGFYGFFTCFFNVFYSSSWNFGLFSPRFQCILCFLWALKGLCSLAFLCVRWQKWWSRMCHMVFDATLLVDTQERPDA